MSDRSTAAIVAANVLTLAVAWWQHWPLALLLWPYWVQSVVIGWYSRKRILSLRQFSLEGTSGFAAPGMSDEDIRRNTARFFVMHYGVFHLAYFFFLLFYTKQNGGMTALDAACVAILGLAFAFTHRSSFQRNLDADSQGRPNIGLVMFLPYLRVLPMHLMIIIGLALGHAGAILLFGLLKTGADVAMHLLEHHLRSRTA